MPDFFTFSKCRFIEATKALCYSLKKEVKSMTQATNPTAIFQAVKMSLEARLADSYLF
jgi:hypothetical protein